MLDHPHAQIIATPIIPPKVMAEIESSDKYYKAKERCLSCDIIRQEGLDKSRIVFENYEYIAFCPYASTSPFEVSIYPKKHEHSFLEMKDNSIIQLSDIVKEVFARLAILLESPALSFALHSAPPIIDRPDFSGYLKNIKLSYHWRLDIRPIVTRSSGFEWATGLSINPLKPEDASLYLKEVALR